MSDRYSNLQHEYAGEFEDLELEDIELEDTEFKTPDEFENNETYGDFEFEGLEEFNEWMEEADSDIYRWPSQRSLKPAPAITIPVGSPSFKLPICRAAYSDLAELVVHVGSLKRSLARKPRDSSRIHNARKDVLIAVKRIIFNIKRGHYSKAKCGRRDFLRLAEKIKKLGNGLPRRDIDVLNEVIFVSRAAASDRSEIGEIDSPEMEREAVSSKPSVRPLFTLACPTGCAPLPPQQCRAVLHRAILDAISLATNAASKLETKPHNVETVRLFRFFFGHLPSRPVPWANNQESGAIVAIRFRRCARELGGGRRTEYRCSTVAPPGRRARVINPSTVLLFPAFWNASPQRGLSDRFFRAGVILHEMLHQLFIEFVRHDDRERRRNNAHCYEAFAMRLARHAADQSDVSQCRERSA